MKHFTCCMKMLLETESLIGLDLSVGVNIGPLSITALVTSHWLCE